MPEPDGAEHRVPDASSEERSSIWRNADSKKIERAADAASKKASTNPVKVPLLLGSRIPMTSLIQTLAVAECLSFHRAALALGTSQSSVIAQIRALEDDLGVMLFDRKARRQLS